MADEKILIEELKQARVEFEKLNDKRDAEVKEIGRANSLLNESVNKSNAQITKLEGDIAAANKRADELEVKVNRAELSPGGASEEAELKNATQFFQQVQKVPADQVQVDVKVYRGYRKALNQYLRFGEQAMHNPEIRNAMSVGSDPDGGYMVLPDTTGPMQKLIYETSPMRELATVQTIGTDALEGINDLDQGTSGGWVTETQARSDTNTAQLGKYRIPVHEQYAQPKATQKLLDDAAVDVEAWLAGKTADILARTETTAFFTGNGVGKPRGFLDYSSGTPSASTWNVIQRIPTGASADFGSPNPADVFISAHAALKNFYRAGAQWLMSRATKAEVRKLKDGQGNYLLTPNFANPSADSILGAQIVECEDMPVIASNSLSIAYGNFKAGYLILDRVGIRVLRDPYTDKPYVKFYTTKRVGGDVVNFEAIKVIKFASS